MEEVIELIHTEVIVSGYENKLSGGIVVTGGGAQLSCLKQLVEYMTGMDTRVGYPNEHLGRSKVELVKSPMFATTVGLVLSGFRAIDERENRYNEARLNGKPGFGKVRKEASSDFFKKILDKTKGLLMDDIDGKSYY
jgi:cell division protein FtsA